jgi:PHP family Zn ribbon phosphoesterase
VHSTNKAASRGLVVNNYRAELHVHTVLSPCGDIEMIPPLIVQEALSKNINIIAITDHNSIHNFQAVHKAAKGTDLTVLPGMEIQTREDVHSLCLFDTYSQAQAFQDFVDQYLPDVENRPDFFGEQFIVDETGDFIRREDRLLLNSVDVSISDASQKATEMGGLFIPAHINRTANGLLAILGFVPQDLYFDALEISKHLSPQEAQQKFPQIRGNPLIQDGDAHYLEDILGFNIFTLQEPNISEIRLAVKQQEGRKHQLIFP